MVKPLSPEDQILVGAVDVVAALDLQTLYETAEPFTIRHFRHRHSKTTEFPAVSLRLVDIERDNERSQIHSQEEVCWVATIDVVVDLKLAAEDNDDEEDLSGWQDLTSVARYVVGKLCDPDGVLRQTLVDDVWPGDIDPDEDSKPDLGRLAHSIYVLYRTAWRDPNRLLPP